MTTKKIIIITGSQGSGKTTHAKALMQHFGCDILVDDWDGRSPLLDGTLALTNHPDPDAAQSNEIHSLESALQAIQHST